MNNQQPSMFEGRTLTIVFLVGVLFLGWQWHLSKKYPKPAPGSPAAQTATVADDSKTTKENPGATDTQTAKNSGETTAPTELPTKEEFTKFEDDVWSFEVSNLGMGIRNVTLKSFKDRKQQPMQVLASTPDTSLSTSLLGQQKPILFSVSKKGDDEFVGEATVNGTKITKSIRVNSKDFRLITQIRAENIDGTFQGFTTNIVDKLQESSGGSILSIGSFDVQEFFVAADGSENRTILAHKENQQEHYKKATVASLGGQYFTQAILDKSAVKPDFDFQTDLTSKIARGTLTHRMLNRTGPFEINLESFAGPKDVKILEAFDPAMAHVVDFGWFSAIARQILNLLRLFFEWFGNWGVAIIALTLIVRIVLLPLHIMSYKSMEGMKKIQPIIKDLREKYKDEPQKLNQEMLVLMRSHKVNPMGGCLPMLLQLPVFFALYRVLGHCIELYQAPFYFWIQDLSMKDPFYVLPILMALTMAIQMKITPSTMEPMQQKIMMFMPIVFAVFTLALPSGLTLYIFVSTLFGVIQQLYFLRKSEANANQSLVANKA